MSPRPPPPPEMGEPLPVTPSAETLELLARRRSASALGLGEPGPDAEALEALLRLAVRVPDHGKLAPWRLKVLRAAEKAPLLSALEPLAAREANPDKARAALGKLRVPPVSVLVIAAPRPGAIPLWEQELSAGAVCMMLLVAAEAMGYGANWITDWYSYAEAARPLLGLAEGERVAGFIHLGTPQEAPLERVRPDLAAVLA